MTAVDQLLAAARHSASLGARKTTLDRYRQIESLAPDSAEALTWLAKYDPDLDIDARDLRFRRALGLGAELGVVDYATWARQLAQSDRPLRARDVLRQLVVRYPDEPEALLRASALFLDLGATQDGLDSFSRLIRPDAPPAPHGDPEQAGRLLDLVIRILDSGWVSIDAETRVLTTLLKAVTPHPAVARRAGELLLERRRLLEARACFASVDANPAADDQLRRQVRRYLVEIATRLDNAELALRYLRSLTDQGDVALLFYHAIALHETGDLGAAGEKCDQARQLATDRMVPVIKRVRAAIYYNSGDFLHAWTEIAEILDQGLAKLEHVPAVRAGLIDMLCQLPSVVRDRYTNDFAAELRWMRNPPAELVDEFDREDLAFRYVTATLARSRAEPERLPDAKRAALDLIARPAATADGAFRQCYLALLISEEDRALQLLDSARRMPSPFADWRNSVLENVLDVRTRGRTAALDRLRDAATSHGSDLDFQCLVVQEAMRVPRQRKWALDRARSLVDRAPQHVLANLLLAECLYRSASVATDPAAADISGLRDAAQHFKRAVDLSDGLERLLLAAPGKRGSSAAEDIGSQVLLPDLQRFAIRRACHAAIRAQDALTSRSLPRDRKMKDVVNSMKDRVGRLDSAQERELKRALTARRLQALVGWLGGWIRLALGLALLAAALGCFLAQVKPSAVIVGLAVVGGVAVLWPYVTRVSMLGVEVERTPAADRIAAHDQDLDIGPNPFDLALGVATLPEPQHIETKSPGGDPEKNAGFAELHPQQGPQAARRAATRGEEALVDD